MAVTLGLQRVETIEEIQEQHFVQNIELQSDESLIYLSDVHLDLNDSNVGKQVQKILDMLKHENPTHLVLGGDIINIIEHLFPAHNLFRDLDAFFTRPDLYEKRYCTRASEIVDKYFIILQPILEYCQENDIKLNWILGNHEISYDHRIKEIIREKFADYLTVPDFITLSSEKGRTILLAHGNFSSSDILEKLFNRFQNTHFPMPNAISRLVSHIFHSPENPTILSSLIEFFAGEYIEIPNRFNNLPEYIQVKLGLIIMGHYHKKLRTKSIVINNGWGPNEIYEYVKVWQHEGRLKREDHIMNEEQ